MSDKEDFWTFIAELLLVVVGVVAVALAVYTVVPYLLQALPYPLGVY